jgi:hypothetical protein
MKQTAVEWLVNYMVENFHLTDESLSKFEQAKAMEREQMEEIHTDGFEQGYNMRYQQEKQKNN